jgi:hypothetical protein
MCFMVQITSQNITEQGTFALFFLSVARTGGTETLTLWCRIVLEKLYSKLVWSINSQQVGLL